MTGRKAPIWNAEELALLKSSIKTATLARHPLMIQNNRTYKAIATRRSWMKKEPFMDRRTATKKEEDYSYNGMPVQLYRPIKIAEARPERMNEWGRLSREEKRAMHQERERGYPM